MTNNYHLLNEKKYFFDEQIVLIKKAPFYRSIFLSDHSVFYFFHNTRIK